MCKNSANMLTRVARVVWRNHSLKVRIRQRYREVNDGLLHSYQISIVYMYEAPGFLPQIAMCRCGVYARSDCSSICTQDLVGSEDLKIRHLLLSIQDHVHIEHACRIDTHVCQYIEHADIDKHGKVVHGHGVLPVGRQTPKQCCSDTGYFFSCIFTFIPARPPPPPPFFSRVDQHILLGMCTRPTRR